MYATAQQMIDTLGMREMLAIADRALTGEVDIALVESKLATAASEINSALAARYALPITADVPALTDKAIAIAHYLLVGAEATETQPVRTRYRDANAWLAEVAASRAHLVDRAGQVVPGIAASPAGRSGSARSFGGKRAFPVGSLRDYGIE